MNANIGSETRSLINNNLQICAANNQSEDMSTKKMYVKGRLVQLKIKQCILFDYYEDINYLIPVKEVEKEIIVVVRKYVRNLTNFVKGEGVKSICVSYQVISSKLKTCYSNLYLYINLMAIIQI